MMIVGVHDLWNVGECARCACRVGAEMVLMSTGYMSEIVEVM